jgi:motility quorum-sensing regulator/GCU-specific mRNA interferase toxin
LHKNVRIANSAKQQGTPISRPKSSERTNKTGLIKRVNKTGQTPLLVEAGKVRATHSARLGATALGLRLQDMLDVVMALTLADFYKSMTTHADHTVWQDVYRPSTQAGDVYLKLTVIDDVLIVSFKEL